MLGMSTASSIGITVRVHVLSVVLPSFSDYILRVLFLDLLTEKSENIDYIYFFSSKRGQMQMFCLGIQDSSHLQPTEHSQCQQGECFLPMSSGLIRGWGSLTLAG